MSKFSNFVKKLLLNLKEEIVMEQPEVEPRNFPKVITERQNTKYSQVRKHLIEKGSIDSWTAINLYGATRLSAIIFKLRNRGYQIDSISRTAYDRNQELCNFTTYKYNNNNGIN
jgi:hypothetical protein